MFSYISILALLLSAAALDAQVFDMSALTNAAQSLIDAAQPFNCEVTQAHNAVAAALNFEAAAQQYLSNPTAAGQSVINNIMTYAGQLMSWPNCWYNEAQRVLTAANLLIQSGAFSG